MQPLEVAGQPFCLGCTANVSLFQTPLHSPLILLLRICPVFIWLNFTLNNFQFLCSCGFCKCWKHLAYTTFNSYGLIYSWFWSGVTKTFTKNWQLAIGCLCLKSCGVGLLVSLGVQIVVTRRDLWMFLIRKQTCPDMGCAELLRIINASIQNTPWLPWLTSRYQWNMLISMSMNPVVSATSSYVQSQTIRILIVLHSRRALILLNLHNLAQEQC